MSDSPHGPDWWQASDGKWYPATETSPPTAAPSSDGPTGSSTGAAIALTLGILSLVACGLLAGIPAIIVGIKARRSIAASAGRQSGDGMALAGVILGILGTAVTSIALIAILAIAFLGESADNQFADVGDAIDSPTLSESSTVPGLTSDVPKAPGPGETITGDTPCPAFDGTAPRVTSFDESPPDCLEPGPSYLATFVTNLGEIKVELDTATTPETVNNFAVLAQYHYYDETAIFRTDPSIDIIQGGAPITNDPADPGPGYTIADEGTDYTYQRGQLVMARTAEPNSAGGQFFFVAGDAASALDADGSYVVFGTVTQGQEIVDEILASHQEDPTSPLGGAPSPPVIIDSVTITAT